MKKLQMNNEQKNLILSVVRQSALWRGNEDLSDLFLEAIYKKSYLLIDAIKDQNRLKRHLAPICETCMEQIIKQSQKFAPRREAKDEIISLKTHDNFNNEEQEVISLKEEFKIPKNNSTRALIDPIEYCPKKEASEQTVEKLIRIIKQIDEKYPKKNYYELFFMRYLKGLNQTEICSNLQISPTELSKRFVELVKLTREKV